MAKPPQAISCGGFVLYRVFDWLNVKNDLNV
jgi:hypothetical protein